MIVLSFDTSLAACSAAIVDVNAGVRVLGSARREPGKGHAEILLSMISDVMTTANVGFEDIDFQVVTVGPGSFTGVRVALSAARGFRIAHDLPIIGIPTTLAIAASVEPSDAWLKPAPTVVIIDARRQQAYTQIVDNTLKPLSDPALMDVDDLADWLEPWQERPLNIVGTGVDLLHSAGCRISKTWHLEPQNPFPEAARFAHFAAAYEVAERPPEPLYLRKPDAKPQIIGQKRDG